MTRAIASRYVSCCAAAIMAYAGAAVAAEYNLNPFASGQYLYESNVYRFSRQVADVTGTTDTADRSQRYTAGLDMGYTWSQQKLHAMVEGRRIQFEEFRHLNHDEHAFDAGLDSEILSDTRGLLNYREERRMASFEDRRSRQLVIEREQIGRGQLSVAVTPDWHILTGARNRKLRSPLPDAPALPQPPPGAPARNASPDFAVREMAYNVGVQFGIENKEHPETEAPLLFGVMLEHQAVSFSGVTPQPAPGPGQQPETFEDYRLLILEVTAQYTFSGVSSLDGKLGATQYYPERSDASSSLDLTGEAGYIRRISALTELSVRMFRRIVPYIASASSATDTGISIGADWEPIVDLTVLANYSWADSAFGGISGGGQQNSGRSDKVQNASLSAACPLSHYFGIRLFGTHSERRSSFAFNSYTDNTVGAELSFRWR